MSDAVRDYQRAAVVAAVLGVGSLIVLGVTGHVAVGMLLCAGLGLGASNTALTQLSSMRLARAASADRRRFVIAAMVRLVVVAVIAVLFAAVFWPDGLGVLVGVGCFYVVLVGVSALRRSGAARPSAVDERPA
jgi:hypothetical protein